MVRQWTIDNEYCAQGHRLWCVCVCTLCCQTGKEGGWYHALNPHRTQSAVWQQETPYPHMDLSFDYMGGAFSFCGWNCPVVGNTTSEVCGP
jgi:hypothetical protein